MSATPDTRPPKNTSGKTNAQNVRPNQRKPFRKSTNEELARRIEWLALEIATQPSMTDGELKRLIKGRFAVHFNTCSEYIVRAKRLLADTANITKEQARQIGVKALLDQVKNEKGSARTQALRLLVEVFGFDAPRRTTLEGMEGAAPIKLETTDKTPVPRLTHARLQELIAMRNQPQQNGNGHFNGSGHQHPATDAGRTEGA